MTPTDDEMRRAKEWTDSYVKQERSNNGLVIQFMTRIGLTTGFAAALAECREAMEFMRALKRRHNGYSRECRDAMPDLKEPSTPDEAITELMEEAAELATMAERERAEHTLNTVSQERITMLEEIVDSIVDKIDNYMDGYIPAGTLVPHYYKNEMKSIVKKEIEPILSEVCGLLEKASQALIRGQSVEHPPTVKADIDAFLAKYRKEQGNG